MRLTDTDISSVLLSLTKLFKKLKNDAPKVQKRYFKTKRDGVINPENHDFNHFKTRHILILSKLYE